MALSNTVNVSTFMCTNIVVHQAKVFNLLSYFRNLVLIIVIIIVLALY